MVLLFWWLSLLFPQSAVLPPLPAVDVAGFEPEIRRQVMTARAALVARPRDAAANGRLGMILQAYERYEPAAVLFERAHRLVPGEFRWAFYLGVVRGELGRADGAIEALTIAGRLRPGHPTVRLRLAESLLAAGRRRESREQFELIRRERPREAAALYGLGRIAIQDGKLELAADLLRQAIEIYPIYGAAHYAYGLVRRDLGQVEEARLHLALSQEHRLKRPPVDDADLAAVAELNLGAAIHLTRGRALEEAGRVEESIIEHEKALNLRPGLVQAHINLITLYGRRGRIEPALEHYRAALAINPDLTDLHYNHGVLLVGAGRPQEALESFERVIKLNPYHPEAHHNLGVIIEQEGRLNEAAAHYRSALRERPGYRSAHFHLGRILVNQSRLREALDQFQLAVEPAPPAAEEEAPGYFYALGATWSMLGERQRAIGALREALRRAVSLRQGDLAASIRRDLQTLGGE